jgi:hypothetical protein
MFDRGSRYEQVPQAVYTRPDGREIQYVLLRMAPPAAQAAATHVVTEGDRLDLLANRYYGDPLQFWRICDANGALLPEDLTATVQARLSIPFGQA